MTLPVEPPVPTPPVPRRRTLRAFAEAGIPIKSDARPTPRPAHRVRPGDTIIRVLAIIEKVEGQRADGTNFVRLTTDDGVTQDFDPDTTLTVWPPDSIAPIPTV